jgi:hypothetical protein
VLPVKFVSPPYCAVSVFAPAVLKAMLQLVAGKVATQVCTPSVTVTTPVGVPAPGGFTVTVKVIGTLCPVTDGSGRSLVIVVVVLAGLTVCPTDAEVLPVKFASPPYCAVSVFAPMVLKAMLQLVAGKVATQDCTPSVTVTTPVGVPAPGGFAVTVKVIGTLWPVTEGSGRSLVIVVVVLALLTVCPTDAEVLPVKLVSPPYCAVSVLAPAVLKAMLQLVAGKVATQV